MNMFTKCEKKFYELIGVNFFRKYILLNFESLLNKVNLSMGYRVSELNIKAFKSYKTQSKYFAIAHAIALVFILLFWPTFLGIVLNIYCILVQRYNHIKINELLAKYEKLQKLKKKHKICEEIADNIDEEPIIDKRYTYIQKKTSEILVAQKILMEQD